MDEPAPEPEVAYEVIVYEELRVQQARDRVLQRLEELGYAGEIVDLGDRVVYRHADPWHGEVVLHDDGWMVVRRQAVRVEARRFLFFDRGSPVAWMGCHVWPWMCVRMSGALYSRRKWMGQESETVQLVEPMVQDWGDRVADLATERTVEALPERLEALWEHGIPLQGGPVLETPEERRAAILAFYASRTDTVWGHEVREAVGAFVRGVVQASDHPFPAEELGAFEAPAAEAP